MYPSRSIVEGIVDGITLRFSESPEPLPVGMVQPGFGDKIMRASFRVGRMNLLKPDGCGDASQFQGFRLALRVSTEVDCERVHNALAEEGTVGIPLEATCWSPTYGMVTDKFGVGWMLVVSEKGA